jgi:tetratricopeptide (TPR) repeat protein
MTADADVARVRAVVEARLLGGAIAALARAYDMLGEPELADSARAGAIEIVERRLGENAELVGQMLWNRATVLVERKEYDAALRDYARALEITRSVHGPEHLDVGVMLGNIADVTRRSGDAAAAVVQYDLALAILEKALGPDHPTLANHLFGRARAHEDAGQRDEAAADLARARAVCDRVECTTELRTKLERMRARIER